MGPSIPCLSFPRHPQVSPTEGVPLDGASLADSYTIPRERWLLVPNAFSLPNQSSRWSVLKEGLRGVAVPNGPGTLA